MNNPLNTLSNIPNINVDIKQFDYAIVADNGIERTFIKYSNDPLELEKELNKIANESVFKHTKANRGELYSEDLGLRYKIVDVRNVF